MKKKYINVKTCIVCLVLTVGCSMLHSCNKDSDPNVIESGVTGALTWKLTADSVLTISGEGAMFDYEFDSNTKSISAPWYAWRDFIKTVVIASGVTNIGNNAFHGCTGLTSVTIPNSITKIGFSTFQLCINLASILVDKGNNNFSSQDGILFNKEKNELIQYPAGKQDTSYTIPNSVTEIGNSAFAYCSALTSVAIPNTITSIGEFAFREAVLTSVTIPNSVTEIGEGAFHACFMLTSVAIPNTIKSIRYRTFFLCDRLTSITIPNSVIEIGESAFSYCYGLTEITVEATTPPNNIGTSFHGNFWEVNRAIPVYVPQGSLQDYKEADGWKEFINLQGKNF